MSKRARARVSDKDQIRAKLVNLEKELTAFREQFEEYQRKVREALLETEGA